MKSWAVKREDGTFLLNKNSTVKLFVTRADAASAAGKLKGKAKAVRVEIRERVPLPKPIKIAEAVGA